MADDSAPGMTEIAMDIALTDGRAEVLVDDVSFFGPGETLEAQASIIASLPANTILGPGTNNVTVRFWPGDSALENQPELKIRFGYSAAGTFPDPFSNRPYAAQIHIVPEPTAALGFRMDQAIPGQPLLNAGIGPDLKIIGDRGVQAQLQLDVKVDLPAQEWKTGQNLGDDEATRQDVIGLTRRAHAALKAGPEGAMRELGPMIQRNAATIGLSAEEALQSEFSVFVDPSLGFELQPFDAERSRLVIMGGGKLATLVPSPVVFKNDATDESGSPILAYWLDNSGNWQIIH